MQAVIDHEANVELEAVACELCGSDRRRHIASRPDLFLHGRTIYHMHECQGCGAIYQHPRPTQNTIGALYPSDYQQYTPAVHTEKLLARLQRRYGLWKRCRAVTRHVRSGRLLDVGCATGDFLGEMRRQADWVVVGIEPSHRAARYAHEHVGLDVVEGVLNTAPFAPGSFDAITMWDVLEHVYDPRQVIAQAARLLRPGGVLLINHPNLESLDRRLFGNLWLGWELPRHLYLFPTQLLQQLMAEHGLIEVDRRCLYGSHAATSTSLLFVFQQLIGQSYTLEVIERVVFSKLMRVLLTPYFWVADRFVKSSNVTVVFKRVE